MSQWARNNTSSLNAAKKSHSFRVTFAKPSLQFVEARAPFLLWSGGRRRTTGSAGTRRTRTRAALACFWRIVLGTAAVAAVAAAGAALGALTIRVARGTGGPRSRMKCAARSRRRRRGGGRRSRAVIWPHRRILVDGLLSDCGSLVFQLLLLLL